MRSFMAEQQAEVRQTWFLEWRLNAINIQPSFGAFIRICLASCVERVRLLVSALKRIKLTRFGLFQRGGQSNLAQCNMKTTRPTGKAVPMTSRDLTRSPNLPKRNTSLSVVGTARQIPISERVSSSLETRHWMRLAPGLSAVGLRGWIRSFTAQLNPVNCAGMPQSKAKSVSSLTKRRRISTVRRFTRARARLSQPCWMITHFYQMIHAIAACYNPCPNHCGRCFSTAISTLRPSQTHFRLFQLIGYELRKSAGLSARDQQLHLQQLVLTLLGEAKTL